MLDLWVCRCGDPKCDGCPDPLENLPPATAECPCGEMLECVCEPPLGWSFDEARREAMAALDAEDTAQACAEGYR
jgi:hypothetical protein